MTAPSLTPLEALTVEAFGLTLDEELDFEPECESPYHEGAIQPAKWLQITPCHHCEGLRCDRCVAYNRKPSTPFLSCPDCRAIFIPSEITFIPLGGTK